MISIIMCSRSEQMLNQVRENIHTTIGVSYEIISIDNSKNSYGICEAYNMGAAKAQYNILCFMHEDILFHTPSWGVITSNILNNSTTGVIGVAGNTFQPKAIGGWTAAGSPYLGINVIQTIGEKTKHDYCNPSNNVLVNAVTLDGLWLCCRKAVWEEFKFDATTFPGFHFYDVDFCVRVSAKYINHLTFDILIEHFSAGTFEKQWGHYAVVFYKKMKKELPIGGNMLTNTEKKMVALSAMHMFLHKAIHNKFPKVDILFCFIECFRLSPSNRDTFYLARILLK